MLRIILNDEIKCFPFLDLEEAKEMRKLYIDKLNANPQIAVIKLEHTDMHPVPNESENRFYIILLKRKNGRMGFRDKDSYVYYDPEEPFYDILDEEEKESNAS
jgi:hypothetical protein